ncbi:ATP-binding cassette domain-containing protein [Streptomyces sp. NPDC046557]|uniref:ATP-binding cassette domain-containing protein n=1 Tax=Streptomyces sp. NPDC046557 TaxID=3155372 RepID=UPI0033EA890B
MNASHTLAQQSTDTAALTARHLYRFYRAGEEETLALRGVALEVRRGESLAVIGPSGSGKSTLLACLAGLDEPDGGTVHVGGERISHRPEAERARVRARRIGVLLQSGNLIAHLDIGANIRLARTAAKRDPPAPASSPSPNCWSESGSHTAPVPCLRSSPEVSWRGRPGRRSGQRPGHPPRGRADR